MSYKSILVHVDDSAHVARRIEVAAQLANDHGALLVGAAMTGATRFMHETLAFNAHDPGLSPYLDILRKRASDALDRFEDLCRRHGVASFERRLVEDERMGDFILHARYSDVAVVGQTDPDGPASAAGDDLPEQVALTSGTPVLIVPYAGLLQPVGRRILVAWNGSRESRHAVQGAMPLLERASHVDAVVFNPADSPDLSLSDAGTDIARYLSRHGVKAELTKRNVAKGDVGDALLSMVADTSSDLLVMGCYGHSRFREMLLGGATRDILASMPVPVLMGH